MATINFVLTWTKIWFYVIVSVIILKIWIWRKRNADSANINVYFYPASWVHKAWNVIPQSAIITHWLRVIFQTCSTRISGAISIESTLMSWNEKGKNEWTWW